MKPVLFTEPSLSAIPRPPQPSIYFGSFFLLALAIVITGYFTFAAVRDTVRHSQQADLAAIATLKTNQIANWVAERKEEARLMSAHSETATQFERWLSQGAPASQDQKRLQTQLNQFLQSSKYRAILLVDLSGKIRLQTGNHPARLDDNDRIQALEAMKTGEILMCDLHLHSAEPGQPACLSFSAPLITGEEIPHIVGALVLQLDPEKFLFPLVQSWPVPSYSAETVLLRIKDNQVAHLTRMRHTKNLASDSPTIPLSPKAPAYLASQGRSGEMEGVDYRGIPVVASVRQIAGTSWHLVAKIDKREIYAPINQIALIALVLTLAFLAATAWLGILWWRKDRMAFELIKSRGARDRQALAAHYDSFIRYANDIVLLMDHNGRIVEANERAAQTYGYTREKLLTLNIRDLRTPAHHDEMENQWREVEAHDGLVFETEHQGQDGSTFPVEVSARFIKIDGDHFHQEFIRDISDRREAQLKLEASHQQVEHARREWESVFDAVSDPIFLHDEEFRILRANLAYADAAGMDIHEIINQPYWKIFPRRNGPLESCLNAFRLGMKDQEEFNEEGRSYVSRSFPTHDGKATKMAVHILEDVTERKQAAQTLKESEERFRKIAAAAQDAIVVINHLGKVTDWNAAAERMFQYSAAEAVGHDMHRLIVPSCHHAEADRGFEQFRSNGTGPVVGKIVEVSGQRKDGSEFPVELSISSVQVKGQWNAIGIIRDITERKHAETLLQRSMQAMATLSAGNTTLVRATDEKSLLDEMCRTIVEVGGYRLAWVGYAQQDACKSVRPMARAGFERDYLDAAKLSWADTAHGRGPGGRAIRSGKTSLVHDILTDPDFAPWREAAIANGYASCIGLPLKDGEYVFGVLCIYSANREPFLADEVKLLEEMAGDLAFGITTLRKDIKRQDAETARAKALEQLNQAMEDVISVVAATLERRDPYTAGHQRRVAQLGVALGKELGLTEKNIEGIHFGGLIHDLGKIAVPAEILSKPGKLSTLEFDMIKTHAEVGYEVIKGIIFPWPVAEMVHQHHERLDGSGYPLGLKDGEIILSAQILAVADVVEAMSSHRPYRPSLGIDLALEEITRHRGKFYASEVVDACIKLFREKEFRFED